MDKVTEMPKGYYRCINHYQQLAVNNMVGHYCSVEYVMNIYSKESNHVSLLPAKHCAGLGTQSHIDDA